MQEAFSMSEHSITPYDSLRKMLLIINPVSGRKTALRHLPDIIRIFSENSWAVTIFLTGKTGDALEYTHLYADKFDTVVCIGGDGTLNEVVCGLVQNGADKPIGYIPSGSTNDFAACHGISSDILIAAKNIAEGHIKEIDLGDFGGKSFSYVAAFGIFSWLSYTTPQNLKNVLGHSAYILDAVKDLPKLKSEHLKFTADNLSFEGDFIFGAVCNSTSIAGTISLPADIVDTSDGKFEVFLVRKPNSIIDFQSIIGGVFNHDYSSPFLEFFQADSLSIQAPVGLEWALDGERFVGAETIYVKNIEKRLKLLL